MVEYSKLFGRLGNQMFQGAYIYAQMKDGYIDDIYLQDTSYFINHEKEIKKLFGTGIGEPVDMVAIHVRRGDYVNNPFYVDLMQTDYYDRAMAEFPDADFLIFSDDIQWCKNQSIFNGCEFSEDKNEVEDLNLMASCRGHIIANSSFSWWGAYLSPYSNKIIAPSKELWYNDGIERTRCPNNWLRL